MLQNHYHLNWIANIAIKYAATVTVYYGTIQHFAISGAKLVTIILLTHHRNSFKAEKRCSKEEW